MWYVLTFIGGIFTGMIGLATFCVVSVKIKQKKLAEQIKNLQERSSDK